MFLVNVKKCLNIFNEVYVSSDDPATLLKAEDAGAKTILRDEELCGDTPNIPVYQHALKFMGNIDGIVAVQANSPTINPNLISIAKKLMETGVDEIMTCHEDYSIYGSIWAICKDKLLNYNNPYKPTPSILIKDESIDIHTLLDYQKSLDN